MHFIKMQGSGNDFILINEKEAEKNVSYGPFARKMCDRHFGIGADGVIVVLPSDVAEVRMRIFNSDGSEAEMCGNGIRCLAKYVYEQAIVPDPIFTVETGAGIIVPEVLLEDEKVRAVRVDMGEPRLYPKEIPVRIQKERVIAEPLLLDDREFRFTAVSMGNPHAVIFEIPENWETFGRKIETLPLFPRKTNVEFVQVLSSRKAEVKIWERGAGVTLACGTGACAVLVAGVLNGVLERQAEIHLPGGSLTMEWSERDNHVLMEGPAVSVFEGDMAEEEEERWTLQPE